MLFRGDDFSGWHPGEVLRRVLQEHERQRPETERQRQRGQTPRHEDRGDGAEEQCGERRTGDTQQRRAPGQYVEHPGDRQRGVKRVEPPQPVVDRHAVGAECHAGEHADNRADQGEAGSDPGAERDPDDDQDAGEDAVEEEQLADATEDRVQDRHRVGAPSRVGAGPQGGLTPGPPDTGSAGCEPRRVARTRYSAPVTETAGW